jgi:hypothetical protein
VKCVYLDFEGGGIQVLKTQGGRIKVYEEEGTFVGSFPNSENFISFLQKVLEYNGTPLTKEEKNDTLQLLNSL